MGDRLHGCKPKFFMVTGRRTSNRNMNSFLVMSYRILRVSRSDCRRWKHEFEVKVESEDRARCKAQCSSIFIYLWFEVGISLMSVRRLLETFNNFRHFVYLIHQILLCTYTYKDICIIIEIKR